MFVRKYDIVEWATAFFIVGFLAMVARFGIVVLAKVLSEVLPF